MIIRRKWRREWARLLARAIAVVAIVMVALVLFRVQRIEGDSLEPNYKDGDLVIMWRSDSAPFLQLRVRGFND